MNRALSRTAVWLLAATLVVVLPLALLVRLRWSPLDHIDARTDDAVHRFVLSHPGAGDAARLVTHLGDPLVVTAMTVVVAVVLAVRRQWRAAAYLLLVRAAAVSVSWVVKTLVDRSRPHLVNPIAHAHGPSFPSGHALGSAALWGSLAVLLAPRLSGPWLVAVAAVIPVVVAATRVLLGVHFVSDVVAGLALGWLVAVVTADLMPLRAHDVTARRGGSQ
jgi:undecaprenyl-diphosphatase